MGKLNTDKIIMLSDCGFKTEFLDDILTCQPFSDLWELKRYLDDNQDVHNWANSETDAQRRDIKGLFSWAAEHIDGVNESLTAGDCGNDIIEILAGAYYFWISGRAMSDCMLLSDFIKRNYNF